MKVTLELTLRRTEGKGKACAPEDVAEILQEEIAGMSVYVSPDGGVNESCYTVEDIRVAGTSRSHVRFSTSR